jgi:tetratricopeptide (TPR) repeat protein
MKEDQRPSENTRPGSNGHGGEEDEWKDLMRLTQSALHQGDPQQALASANEMMQRAAKLGESHPRYWSALRLLGDVHFAMSSTQEAEKFYTQYLGLVKSHEGDEMLQVLVNFAAVQIQAGKVADAAFSLQRALLRAGRRRHAYGFINQCFGKLEDELNQEQFVKSKRIAEIYQRIGEAAARALGTDATEYGVALGNWAVALHLQKKDAEAEPKLKQAIALSQQDDQNALNAARFLERLSEIFRSQSQLDKAEETMKKALAIREKHASAD